MVYNISNLGKEKMFMDLNVLLQAITTVGFPIAMCLLLFWYIREQSESHKSEIDKLSEAVNNNTLIIQRLTDILERKE